MDGADLGGASASLSAVEAIAADDVWAVGQFEATSTRRPKLEPLIEHWDGRSWSRADVDPSHPEGAFVPTRIAAVDSVGPGDVWALGRAGVNGLPGESTTSRDSLLHWDGTRWSFVRSPQDERPGGSSSMQDLSAVRSTDVWAVGGTVDGHSEAGRAGGARVERWDGRAWVLANDPPTGRVPLTRVSAVGREDVWAIRGGDFENGEGGYGFGPTSILHWDGVAWQMTYRLPPGESNWLTDIEGAGRRDAWAVGQSRPGRPLILRWAGRRWTEPSDGVMHGSLGTALLRPSLSIAKDGTVAVFVNRQDGPRPSIGNNLWLRCP
jgi:hypothetical protein